MQSAICCLEIGSNLIVHINLHLAIYTKSVGNLNLHEERLVIASLINILTAKCDLVNTGLYL